MNKYVLGSEITLSASFKVGTVDTDPTNVGVKVKTPGGALTSKTYASDVEVIKDSTGKYHMNIAAVEAGLYTYRFEGTGACQSAGETQFIVNSSEFYP